jgi:hypothetical protein
MGADTPKINSGGRDAVLRCPRFRLKSQSETPALDDRLPKPYGVQGAGRVHLSRCHPNRVQVKEIMTSMQSLLLSF